LVESLSDLSQQQKNGEIRGGYQWGRRGEGKRGRKKRQHQTDDQQK